MRVNSVQKKNATAIVTGASSGIGLAFASLLAQKGYNLLLIARNINKLNDLAKTLSTQYDTQCNVLSIDLSEENASKKVLEYIITNNLNISVLINNAGFSGNYKFLEADWSQLSKELNVMSIAVTELCYLIAPLMEKNSWGRIINVSSGAAYLPPTQSLLYTGLKSYVLNFSQSLDMELKPKGINVTALCPGFTRSEFHNTMGTNKQVSKVPNFLWQAPEQVALEGWHAVMKGHPVCIPGLINKIIISTSRHLPLNLQYNLGKLMNPFK